MTSVNNSSAATAVLEPKTENNTKPISVKAFQDMMQPNNLNGAKVASSKMPAQKTTNESPKASSVQEQLASGSPKPKDLETPKPEAAKGFWAKFNKRAGDILNQKWINKVLFAGDIASAVTDFFRIPMVKDLLAKSSLAKLLPWKLIKHVIDVWSVRLTKSAIMLRYINAGLGALINNRIVEAFGRVGGIMALPFVKLEDLTLATGLSTFFSQTDLGLEQKIGAKKKAKYESMWANAKEWFGTWFTLSKEILLKGFAGADRNLFPDFAWSQITELPKKFLEDFRTEGKIGVPGEKERGHTAVFGAYFIGFGALIGVLFGRKSRNLWNKIGGVIRNFGGILGDYSLVTHTDPNMRRGGYFFGMATVVDAIQRFLPGWMINTINHLNLINNMIAADYYSNRTQKRNEGDIAVSGDGNNAPVEA